MKIRKFLCLCLALCMIAGGLIACDSQPAEKPTDDTPATPVLTLGNIVQTASQYAVVRGDNASATVKDATVLVRDIIAKYHGTAIEIKTDWLEDGETVDAAKPEILIGKTNRPESTQAAEGLKAGQYAIKQIDAKICIVGADDAATVKAVNEFLNTYFGYKAESYDYHNVMQYGAVGDGKADDTKAFLAAIAAAEKDGLPVYVPYGKYMITDTLELKSVTLYGYNTGAWTADNCDLPIVYHNNLEVPLFDVISGSVSGLHIEVQGVNADTQDAAETIRVTDTGGRVSNLTIRSPYIAVSTYYNKNTSGNPGRCFIENLFIVQAWKMGVNVYGTYDVATMCNIEVWNNNMEHSCPIAFQFGHNDDLRAVNLFTFNANIGFFFEETDQDTGGCWGSFTNCSVDYTSIGVRVGKGTHHLTFVGGTYWTHHMGLNVLKASADSLVAMSGCEMKSNGENTLKIEGGGQVTVAGCNIRRTMKGATNETVAVSGGKAVTITGNTIVCNGVPVKIENAFQGLLTVTGNSLVSSGNTMIRNNSSRGTVMSEGNGILMGQDVAD